MTEEPVGQFLVWSGAEVQDRTLQMWPTIECA